MPESTVAICDCNITELCEICLTWLKSIKHNDNIIRQKIKINTENILNLTALLHLSPIINISLDPLKTLLEEILLKNNYIYNSTVFVKINPIINYSEIYLEMTKYIYFIKTILTQFKPIIFKKELDQMNTIVQFLEQFKYITDEDHIILDLKEF